jgi:tetratricopeptide (TPR) repeat protein
MPPQTQALASVYLGMAHLMRGNPRDATESLFADKPHLIDGPVKNASAFVTSLARFRLLNGTMQEREATFLYRALVAIEEDAEWLGPTGQLLIGQALLSLGLGDKMFEHYQKALDKNILPVGIAHEMRFAMAENLLRERKPQDAELLLMDLSLNGEGAIQAKSRMRLAEIALNNNRPEDCLSACRDLFATTSPDKQALLRLAGRAYEQLGQNALAAECYRGRLPPP